MVQGRDRLNHCHDAGAGHSRAGHMVPAAGHGQAFAIGVSLNLLFVAVEAGAGLAIGSLALLADAGHNLSDVAGLLLAWGAAWLSSRRPTGRHTYGFGRTSILAALGNAMLLLMASGAILWEAAGRFSDPQPVQGGVVMAVAAVGVGINLATALLFVRGKEANINIKGAYLHMAADAAVSFGVLVAGLLITATGLPWIDPFVSLAVVAVIVVGTWGLLKDSVALSLDAVPKGIDRADVESYLLALPGVTEVHDIHIWPLSTTDTALTAHLVRPGYGQNDEFVFEVGCELAKRFGIGHPTVQIETAVGVCPLASPDVV